MCNRIIYLDIEVSHFNLLISSNVDFHPELHFVGCCFQRKSVCVVLTKWVLYVFMSHITASFVERKPHHILHLPEAVLTYLVSFRPLTKHTASSTLAASTSPVCLGLQAGLSAHQGGCEMARHITASFDERCMPHTSWSQHLSFSYFILKIDQYNIIIVKCNVKFNYCENS